MTKLQPRSKLLVVGLVLIFAVNQVFAQRSVTGTITDAATGEPLIGATIILEGTSVGAVTDFQGKYEINVPGAEAVVPGAAVVVPSATVVVPAVPIVGVVTGGVIIATHSPQHSPGISTSSSHSRHGAHLVTLFSICV